MKLNEENIEQAIQTLTEAMDALPVEKKEALSTRLAMEEIMLRYQDSFGADTEFSFRVKKRFGRLHILCSFDSPRLDPMEKGDESFDFMQLALASQGLAPLWSYQNGQNVIAHTLKKQRKNSAILTLVYSIIAAVVVGMLCRMLPGDLAETVSTRLIEPLFNAFLRLITCIAGPLIFLSVAWGIYSIGDVASLERIGKRMAGRFMLMLTLLSLVSLLAVLPMFTLAAGSGGQLDFFVLYTMILDIIPDNIFTPFSTGNTLQIIFLAISVGFAILLLGKKTTTVAQLIGQNNYVVQIAMDFVNGLMSVFVFISVLSIIFENNLANMNGLYKVLPVMLITCLLPMLFYFAFTVLRYRISPARLLKKIMPTFLIALSTASSAAAFTENVNCCTEKLGIDKKIADFGVPLGQIVFPIGCAMEFISIGFCVAEMSGLAITPKWLFTLFLLSVVLAIAIPPIPGGAVACFTVFAAQLEIPTDLVSMCITISVVMDFIATATNLFCLQLELVCLSDSLDMLDQSLLRS